MTRRSNPADASAGFPYPRLKAPVGIRCYCVFGTVAAGLSVVFSLVLLTRGGQTAVLGLGLLLFSAGQIVVFHGLWTLSPWGWTWAVVSLLGVVGVAVVRAEPLGAAVALVVLAYLYLRRSYYRPG